MLICEELMSKGFIINELGYAGAAGIGAASGAGIAGAVWAKKRYALNKELNNCRTSDCKNEVRGRIANLRKKALKYGAAAAVGGAAIGAGAKGAHQYMTKAASAGVPTPPTTAAVGPTVSGAGGTSAAGGTAKVAANAPTPQAVPKVPTPQAPNAVQAVQKGANVPTRGVPAVARDAGGIQVKVPNNPPTTTVGAQPMGRSTPPPDLGRANPIKLPPQPAISTPKASANMGRAQDISKIATPVKPAVKVNPNAALRASVARNNELAIRKANPNIR